MGASGKLVFFCAAFVALVLPLALFAQEDANNQCEGFPKKDSQGNVIEKFRTCFEGQVKGHCEADGKCKGDTYKENDEEKPLSKTPYQVQPSNPDSSQNTPSPTLPTPQSPKTPQSESVGNWFRNIWSDNADTNTNTNSDTDSRSTLERLWDSVWDSPESNPAPTESTQIAPGLYEETNPLQNAGLQPTAPASPVGPSISPLNPFSPESTFSAGDNYTPQEQEGFWQRAWDRFQEGVSEAYDALVEEWSGPDEGGNGDKIAEAPNQTPDQERANEKRAEMEKELKSLYNECRNGGGSVTECISNPRINQLMNDLKNSNPIAPPNSTQQPNQPPPASPTDRISLEKDYQSSQEVVNNPNAEDSFTERAFDRVAEAYDALVNRLNDFEETVIAGLGDSSENENAGGDLEDNGDANARLEPGPRQGDPGRALSDTQYDTSGNKLSGTDVENAQQENEKITEEYANDVESLTKALADETERCPQCALIREQQLEKMEAAEEFEKRLKELKTVYNEVPLDDNRGVVKEGTLAEEKKILDEAQKKLDEAANQGVRICSDDRPGGCALLFKSNDAREAFNNARNEYLTAAENYNREAGVYKQIAAEMKEQQEVIQNIYKDNPALAPVENREASMLYNDQKISELEARKAQLQAQLDQRLPPDSLLNAPQRLLSSELTSINKINADIEALNKANTRFDRELDIIANDSLGYRYAQILDAKPETLSPEDKVIQREFQKAFEKYSDAYAGPQFNEREIKAEKTWQDYIFGQSPYDLSKQQTNAIQEMLNGTESKMRDIALQFADEAPISPKVEQQLKTAFAAQRPTLDLLSEGKFLPIIHQASEGLDTMQALDSKTQALYNPFFNQTGIVWYAGLGIANSIDKGLGYMFDAAPPAQTFLQSQLGTAPNLFEQAQLIGNPKSVLYDVTSPITITNELAIKAPLAGAEFVINNPGIFNPAALPAIIAARDLAPDLATPFSYDLVSLKTPGQQFDDLYKTPLQQFTSDAIDAALTATMVPYGQIARLATLAETRLAALTASQEVVTTESIASRITGSIRPYASEIADAYKTGEINVNIPPAYRPAAEFAPETSFGVDPLRPTTPLRTADEIGEFTTNLKTTTEAPRPTSISDTNPLIRDVLDTQALEREAAAAQRTAAERFESAVKNADEVPLEAKPVERAPDEAIAQAQKERDTARARMEEAREPAESLQKRVDDLGEALESRVKNDLELQRLIKESDAAVREAEDAFLKAPSKATDDALKAAEARLASIIESQPEQKAIRALQSELDAAKLEYRAAQKDYGKASATLAEAEGKGVRITESATARRALEQAVSDAEQALARADARLAELRAARETAEAKAGDLMEIYRAKQALVERERLQSALNNLPWFTSNTPAQIVRDAAETFGRQFKTVLTPGNSSDLIGQTRNLLGRYVQSINWERPLGFTTGLTYPNYAIVETVPNSAARGIGSTVTIDGRSYFFRQPAQLSVADLGADVGSIQNWSFRYSSLLPSQSLVGSLESALAVTPSEISALSAAWKASESSSIVDSLPSTENAVSYVRNSNVPDVLPNANQNDVNPNTPTPEELMPLGTLQNGAQGSDDAGGAQSQGARAGVKLTAEPGASSENPVITYEEGGHVVINIPRERGGQTAENNAGTSVYTPVDTPAVDASAARGATAAEKKAIDNFIAIRGNPNIWNKTSGNKTALGYLQDAGLSYTYSEYNANGPVTILFRRAGDPAVIGRTTLTPAPTPSPTPTAGNPLGQNVVVFTPRTNPQLIQSPTPVIGKTYKFLTQKTADGPIVPIEVVLVERYSVGGSFASGIYRAVTTDASRRSIGVKFFKEVSVDELQHQLRVDTDSVAAGVREQSDFAIDTTNGVIILPDLNRGDYYALGHKNPSDLIPFNSLTEIPGWDELKQQIRDTAKRVGAKGIFYPDDVYVVGIPAEILRGPTNRKAFFEPIDFDQADSIPGASAEALAQNTRDAEIFIKEFEKTWLTPEALAKVQPDAVIALNERAQQVANRNLDCVTALGASAQLAAAPCIVQVVMAGQIGQIPTALKKDIENLGEAIGVKTVSISNRPATTIDGLIYDLARGTQTPESLRKLAADVTARANEVDRLKLDKELLDSNHYREIAGELSDAADDLEKNKVPPQPVLKSAASGLTYLQRTFDELTGAKRQESISRSFIGRANQALRIGVVALGLYGGQSANDAALAQQQALAPINQTNTTVANLKVGPTITTIASEFGYKGSSSLNAPIMASGKDMRTVVQQGLYYVSHKSLPMGTRLVIFYPDTGRAILAEVQERGPAPSLNRDLDLLPPAAAGLGIRVPSTKGIHEVQYSVIQTDANSKRLTLGPINSTTKFADIAQVKAALNSNTPSVAPTQIAEKKTVETASLKTKTTTPNPPEQENQIMPPAKNNPTKIGETDIPLEAQTPVAPPQQTAMKPKLVSVTDYAKNQNREELKTGELTAQNMPLGDVYAQMILAPRGTFIDAQGYFIPNSIPDTQILFVDLDGNLVPTPPTGNPYLRSPGPATKIKAMIAHTESGCNKDGKCNTATNVAKAKNIINGFKENRKAYHVLITGEKTADGKTIVIQLLPFSAQANAILDNGKSRKDRPHADLVKSNTVHFSCVGASPVSACTAEQVKFMVLGHAAIASQYGKNIRAYGHDEIQAKGQATLLDDVKNALVNFGLLSAEKKRIGEGEGEAKLLRAMQQAALKGDKTKLAALSGKSTVTQTATVVENPGPRTVTPEESKQQRIAPVPTASPELTTYVESRAGSKVTNVECTAGGCSMTLEDGRKAEIKMVDRPHIVHLPNRMTTLSELEKISPEAAALFSEALRNGGNQARIGTFNSNLVAGTVRALENFKRTYGYVPGITSGIRTWGAGGHQAGNAFDFGYRRFKNPEHIAAFRSMLLQNGVHVFREPDASGGAHDHAEIVYRGFTNAAGKMLRATGPQSTALTTGKIPTFALIIDGQQTGNVFTMTDVAANKPTVPPPNQTPKPEETKISAEDAERDAQQTGTTPSQKTIEAQKTKEKVTPKKPVAEPKKLAAPVVARPNPVVPPQLAPQQTNTVAVQTAPTQIYYPHWAAGNGEITKAILDKLPKGATIAVHHDPKSTSDATIRMIVNHPGDFKISWYTESKVSEKRDTATGRSVASRIAEARNRQDALVRSGISAERFTNEIELDAAREKSAAERLADAQIVKDKGFTYLAKSLGPQAIAELRSKFGDTFISRIVFEDVVNDKEYQRDAIALANAGENITLIIHNNGYDGDKGTDIKTARSVVAQNFNRPNVTAFFGLKSSFAELKLPTPTTQIAQKTPAPAKVAEAPKPQEASAPKPQETPAQKLVTTPVETASLPVPAKEATPPAPEPTRVLTPDEQDFRAGERAVQESNPIPRLVSKWQQAFIVAEKSTVPSNPRNNPFGISVTAADGAPIVAPPQIARPRSLAPQVKTPEIIAVETVETLGSTRAATTKLGYITTTDGWIDALTVGSELKDLKDLVDKMKELEKRTDLSNTNKLLLLKQLRGTLRASIDSFESTTRSIAARQGRDNGAEVRTALEKIMPTLRKMADELDTLVVLPYTDPLLEMAKTGNDLEKSLRSQGYTPEAQRLVIQIVDLASRIEKTAASQPALKTAGNNLANEARNLKKIADITEAIQTTASPLTDLQDLSTKIDTKCGADYNCALKELGSAQTKLQEAMNGTAAKKVKDSKGRTQTLPAQKGLIALLDDLSKVPGLSAADKQNIAALKAAFGTNAQQIQRAITASTPVFQALIDLNNAGAKLALANNKKLSGQEALNILKVAVPGVKKSANAAVANANDAKKEFAKLGLSTTNIDKAISTIANESDSLYKLIINFNPSLFTSNDEITAFSNKVESTGASLKSGGLALRDAVKNLTKDASKTPSEKLEQASKDTKKQIVVIFENQGSAITQKGQEIMKQAVAGLSKTLEPKTIELAHIVPSFISTVAHAKTAPASTDTAIAPAPKPPSRVETASQTVTVPTPSPTRTIVVQRPPSNSLLPTPPDAAKLVPDKNPEGTAQETSRSPDSSSLPVEAFLPVAAQKSLQLIRNLLNTLGSMTRAVGTRISRPAPQQPAPTAQNSVRREEDVAQENITPAPKPETANTPENFENELRTILADITRGANITEQVRKMDDLAARLQVKVGYHRSEAARLLRDCGGNSASAVLAVDCGALNALTAEGHTRLADLYEASATRVREQSARAQTDGAIDQVTTTQIANALRDVKPLDTALVRNLDRATITEALASVKNSTPITEIITRPAAKPDVAESSESPADRLTKQGNEEANQVDAQSEQSKRARQALTETLSNTVAFAKSAVGTAVSGVTSGIASTWNRFTSALRTSEAPKTAQKTATPPPIPVQPPPIPQSLPPAFTPSERVALATNIDHFLEVLRVRMAETTNAAERTQLAAWIRETQGLKAEFENATPETQKAIDRRVAQQIADIGMQMQAIRNAVTPSQPTQTPPKTVTLPTPPKFDLPKDEQGNPNYEAASYGASEDLRNNFSVADAVQRYRGRLSSYTNALLKTEAEAEGVTKAAIAAERLRVEKLDADLQRQQVELYSADSLAADARKEVIERIVPQLQALENDIAQRAAAIQRNQATAQNAAPDTQAGGGDGTTPPPNSPNPTPAAAGGEPPRDPGTIQPRRSILSQVFALLGFGTTVNFVATFDTNTNTDSQTQTAPSKTTAPTSKTPVTTTTQKVGRSGGQEIKKDGTQTEPDETNTTTQTGTKDKKTETETKTPTDTKTDTKTPPSSPTSPSSPKSPSDSRTSSNSSSPSMGSIMGALSQLLGLLKSYFMAQPQTPVTTPTPTQSTESTTTKKVGPPIVMTLIAQPSTVQLRGSTTLKWSSVGASRCAVYGPGSNKLANVGPNGTITTPTMIRSTEFGVVCSSADSSSNGSHAIVITVEGTTADPIRVTMPERAPLTSAPVNAATQGAQQSQPAQQAQTLQPVTTQPTVSQPATVSTCNPNQTMDAFILCLQSLK